MKFLLTVLLATCGLFAGDSPAFDYDKKAPLDPREQEVTVRNDVRVSMLTYANPAGGRADAMLVTPVDLKGRTAAIIWMHSGGYYNQPVGRRSDGARRSRLPAGECGRTRR